jgi:predicted dehydrogenase
MPFDLALIGLKGHQYVVLEALPDLPDVRLIAVADDDPSALARVPDFPSASDQTPTYSDYRDLLRNHRPDIVVEAGTDNARADVLVSCAERGIDLIAEKPLACDLKGLHRVEQAVAAAGVKCSMLLTMRCEPLYLAVRQAVSEGVVGEIAQAAAQKSYRLGQRPDWQKSRRTFSGIIPFIGIHALDLIRWTTGQEFVEIMGCASNVAHPEIGELEDNAAILARLDNGASVAVRLDYCRPAAAPTHGDDRLRIAGGRGVIEAKEERVTLITSEEGSRELPLPPPVNLFSEYLDALRDDRDPFIPFADCVRITEVALRARKAAESGRPAKLT